MSQGSKYAPKRETAKAQAFFEAYAALGPSRSLTKLAEDLVREHGGSKTSRLHYLGLLSSAFAWQDRIKSYDAEKAEERRRRREARYERMMDRHAKIGKQGLAMATEALDKLHNSGRIGSQAAVQLLTASAQIERDAMKDMMKEAGDRNPGQIQIIILTDAPDAKPKAIERPIIESTIVDAG